MIAAAPRNATSRGQRSHYSRRSSSHSSLPSTPPDALNNTIHERLKLDAKESHGGGYIDKVASRKNVIRDDEVELIEPSERWNSMNFDTLRPPLNYSQILIELGEATQTSPPPVPRLEPKPQSVRTNRYAKQSNSELKAEVVRRNIKYRLRNKREFY